MDTLYKTFSITALALLPLFFISSLSAATTIKITNNISPIQIGATVYDNGGNKGSPSINIWPPGSGGGGTTLRSSSTWTYNTSVSNGSNATFGVQINAARLSGQCDQLCGHVKVSVSSDGKTCSVSQGSGTCGSNAGAPKWTVPSQSNISIRNGVCNVTLSTVRILSKVVCGCKDGSYPCSTKVICGPGTPTPNCPVKPPYHW